MNWLKRISQSIGYRAGDQSYRGLAFEILMHAVMLFDGGEEGFLAAW